MSLIPSESLNFPDSFRADVGWRLPKQNGGRKSRPARREARTTARERSAWINETRHSVSETITDPTKEPFLPPSPSEPELIAPEQSDQLELIPKSAGEFAASEVSADTAEAGPESVLDHLFRLAASTGTLVGPPEVASPAATEPVRPSSIPSSNGGLTDSTATTAEAAQPPDVDVPQTADTSVNPHTATEPTSSPAPAVLSSDFTIQPDEFDRLAELPEEPSPPEVESTPAETPVHPSPLVIDTPAQANHILELITAAGQRGALVGGPVPQSEPIAPKQTAPPETAAEPKSSLQVNEVAPPQEAAKSATIPSPIPDSATPNVPKVPAKIRITPRKIKPRAPGPAEPERAVESPLLGSYFENAFGTGDVPTASANVEKSPIPPVNAGPIAKTPSMAKPTVPLFNAREMASRKIATTRDRKAPDLALSMARERRNRWIGFGLSEVFSLTALGLLGWFALTHHFPDPTLKLLVFILLLAAAAIAVALPIAFIRNNPGRWQRRD